MVTGHLTDRTPQPQQTADAVKTEYTVELADDSENPFHFTLPPLIPIAVILFTFFILVIPVTYFKLRYIERLERAWITTPLVSLVFVFIIFLFSASLYRDKASRRATGVLTVEPGETRAVFDGKSDIFFPHGGNYDIKVYHGDALEEIDLHMGVNDALAALNQSSNLLDTVDTPYGIEAPSLAVNNLAFRRLYYTQTVTLTGPITVRIKGNKGGGYAGVVKNGTSMTLDELQIGDVPLGALAPGKSISVSGEFLPLQESDMRPSPLLPGVTHILALTARVPGAQFGPQYGKDVSGDSSVTFKSYLPVANQKEAQ